MTKRTTYTKEFKQEAVRLLESGDKPAVEGIFGVRSKTCL